MDHDSSSGASTRASSLAASRENSNMGSRSASRTNLSKHGTATQREQSFVLDGQGTLQAQGGVMTREKSDLGESFVVSSEQKRSEEPYTEGQNRE